jgi:acetolactate synthase-1/2/3 large subunit
MRINRAEDVEEALKKAMQVNDRPVIIDFWVEREAGVYPMVPPGESISNMLGGEIDE